MNIFHVLIAILAAVIFVINMGINPTAIMAAVIVVLALVPDFQRYRA